MYISGTASCRGEGDTVVLVRDPLACLGREKGNRGGRAEAEGIKMACPPPEVRHAIFPSRENKNIAVQADE